MIRRLTNPRQRHAVKVLEEPSAEPANTALFTVVWQVPGVGQSGGERAMTHEQATQYLAGIQKRNKLALESGRTHLALETARIVPYRRTW
jgi:hypothetical protein